MGYEYVGGIELPESWINKSLKKIEHLVGDTSMFFMIVIFMVIVLGLAIFIPVAVLHFLIKSLLRLKKKEEESKK